MARIPAVTETDPKPWRVKQGHAVIKIGAAASNDPDGMHGTLVSVGLTDGGVSWNPNVESDELRSDQMFNAHGVVETAWNHQLSLSLDQSDIYNIALALSYDQDAVTSSSMLSLNGYEPSPYRSVRVMREGATNVAGDTPLTDYIDFWKAKVIADGAMEIGRATKTTLPITVTGIANNDDKVGQYASGVAIAAPAYE